MPHTIAFTPAARRELDRLPGATQDRIVRKVQALALNPRPPGSLKMAGEDDTYRIRVGDFRVLYVVDDGVLTVLVVRVGTWRCRGIAE